MYLCVYVHRDTRVRGGERRSSIRPD